jgi:DNA polymerase elongation subunit (family B)
MTKVKPKIIVVDIETSAMLTATFSLYPENIGHNNIVQDWFIICAAWKELGSKKVESIAITKPGDDKAVVKKLREVLANADIIIGHNYNSFDRRKVNARLIYHRLPPLPQVHIVDTLREIKKVAVFSSHRLDYLSKHLLGAGKMETSAGLWLRAMNADKKAIKEMVSYNKIDVVRNEEVYTIIKPYLKSHPHTGAMMGLDRHLSCPKCGSLHFEKGRTKLRYTAAGIPRVQKQCIDCHSYTTFKQ